MNENSLFQRYWQAQGAAWWAWPAAAFLTAISAPSPSCDGKQVIWRHTSSGTLYGSSGHRPGGGLRREYDQAPTASW